MPLKKKSRSPRRSPRRSTRRSPRRSKRRSTRRKSLVRSRSRRRRSRNKDGAGENIIPGGNVGRFHIKSVINMPNYVKEELKNIENDAIMNYTYNIDFTKEKEFNDILKSNNVNVSKIKLDRYIELVKNYILYPIEEIENFRENYLKKLLDLKETLNKKVVVLPQKRVKRERVKKIKKPLDILERIEEEHDDLSQYLSYQPSYEDTLPLQPSLSRQSSYEDTPYIENGIELYKHKTEPEKKRFYWTKDRYFDIVDQ